MSGLCGCIHHAGQPAHTETAREMADAGSHRGSDGIETWSGAHASLGHLALKVTSEDDRESQPLVEGPLVLVADARIDDRATLQLKVRSKLRPSSPTDADLILSAYRRWGTDCLKHLLGDFAFAIWDQGKQRLFAARDRPRWYRLLLQRAPSPAGPLPAGAD